MPAYLETIVAAHRADAALDGRDLEAAAEQAWRPARPGRSRLPSGQAAARDGMAVISEIKRRSPSKGDLDPDLDPAARGRRVRGRGSGVPVGAHRRGSSSAAGPSDLGAARAGLLAPCAAQGLHVGPPTCATPGVMGADAVLLIVAALTDPELESFLDLARPLLAGRAGRGARRATSWPGPSDAGAELVGVNQRDLRTFEVDPSVPSSSARVDPGRRGGRGRVGDPRARTTSRRLADAGYQAVLVGEALVRSVGPAGGRGRPARGVT